MAALAFNDQIALAIENARLRTQAEQAAVIAERNRLARELHDAVSQTLFSTSLIAEVLPRLWDRNQPEGQQVELIITDDGCGFDPGAVSPEHLGLGIMHERAAAINAVLNFKSRPGCGTQIEVV